MSSLTVERKLEKLKNVIQDYPRAALAFSGGVDSSLLAAIGKEVLKDNILLLHAVSAVHPRHERELAQTTAGLLGLPLVPLKMDILSVSGFSANPPERCYICKKALFSALKKIALERDCPVLFDGSIADDAADYRPGRRALKELGIVSPLALAGLTKAEIRQLARNRNLPAADVPSNACLASRIPYGDPITAENLAAVEKIEDGIRELGFTGFRARCHGSLIRFEFGPKDMARAFGIKDKLAGLARQNGFTYAALDLTGYRTGALNEVLTQKAMPAVRPMEAQDADTAYDLVERGFNQFVSAGFKPKGIREFFNAVWRFIYERPAGQFNLVAEIGNKIAGIINMRDNYHIGLFFVDPGYLRRGVGRALMRAAEGACLKANPDLTEIEVNSSLYAVPVYEKLGFKTRKPVQEINGMRFVKMGKKIQKYGIT